MSHQRPTVLIVSNGYGEDAVGDALAHELAGKVEIVAYPLVGLGNAYKSIPLLDPRKDLPSGGFGLRGTWLTLLADFREGAWGLLRDQRRTLRGQRGRHTPVVAIGDVFCLWMAALAGDPVVFIATAKSEFNEPHRWLERALIKRYASIVYTRDAITADVLSRNGLPARYVGNPLMDTIDSDGSLERDPNLLTVTLLPGSRADALGNLGLMLQLCTEVWRSQPTNTLCAVAPLLDLSDVVEVAARSGWQPDGLTLRSPLGSVVLMRSFGSAVFASDVVVGLAGTANEQAAGLGKPVVAFPGTGPQYTQRFMRLQSRLLGDALVTTSSWQEGAKAVKRLLSDPNERAHRGQIGRQRMGSPGAIKRIADYLAGQIESPQKSANG